MIRGFGDKAQHQRDIKKCLDASQPKRYHWSRQVFHAMSSTFEPVKAQLPVPKTSPDNTTMRYKPLQEQFTHQQYKKGRCTKHEEDEQISTAVISTISPLIAQVYPIPHSVV
jgi:hypothetical protein